MSDRAGNRRRVRTWFFHHEVVVGRCTDGERWAGDRVNRIHESGFTAIDGEGVDDDSNEFSANGIGVDASDELLLVRRFGPGRDELDSDVFLWRLRRSGPRRECVTVDWANFG